MYLEACKSLYILLKVKEGSAILSTEFSPRGPSFSSPSPQGSIQPVLGNLKTSVLHGQNTHSTQTDIKT